MVRLARLVGLAAMIGSAAFAIFYVLWFLGLTPLDPQLAVKIPILAIVLGLCFIAGWLGYVMARSPVPPR
jgi:predicted lysophospholipase L1 biosynthesis ABC-type transport system permease subunit